MPTRRFEEHQRFTQVWLWVLLVGLAALLGWGFVHQVLWGKPWGSQPATDLVLWIVFPLVGLGFPIFIAMLRLDTVVTDEEVQVRLWPLPARRIPLSQIQGCRARRYRPIREYGGWGVRYGFKRGWAYNVKGNEGAQLEIEGAKPLLIGSQRSAELAAAINIGRPGNPA